MSDVVVMFRAPDDQPGNEDRGSEYSRLLQSTAQATQRLVLWLHSAGLWSEVGDIGEPNPFGLVVIQCTPRVAKLIQSAPEVESVSSSDSFLELIH